MSKDNRQIRLGAFIMATGHHIAAWRHPDAQADAGHNIDHYRELAKTAERGKFDLVFVADSPAGWEGDRDPAILERVSHRHAFRAGDAVVGAVAGDRAISASSPPHRRPTRIRICWRANSLSLDHISKGRAAWNVVTTAADVSTQFLDRRASGACQPLRAGGRVRRPRARPLGFATRTTPSSATSRAASSSTRPRSTRSIIRANSSPSPGRSMSRARRRAGRWWCRPAPPSPAATLAARTAEVIFTANQTLADAQEFYSDLKGRLAKFGRRRDELLIMPGIFPVIGGTEAEAQEKYEFIQSLVHPSIAWAHPQAVLCRGRPVGLFARRQGAAAACPYRAQPEPAEAGRRPGGARPDAAPALSVAGHGARPPHGGRHARADRRRDRAVVQARRGRRLQHHAADPAHRAHRLRRPGGADPAQRGLYRSDYAGPTLRENLGLARPQNRFACAPPQLQPPRSGAPDVKASASSALPAARRARRAPATWSKASPRRSPAACRRRSRSSTCTRSTRRSARRSTRARRPADLRELLDAITQRRCAGGRVAGLQGHLFRAVQASVRPGRAECAEGQAGGAVGDRRQRAACAGARPRHAAAVRVLLGRHHRRPAIYATEAEFADYRAANSNLHRPHRPRRRGTELAVRRAARRARRARASPDD